MYGIREGSAGGNGSNQYVKKELQPKNSVQAKKSQSDIAAQMGISVDTLQNYKMLAEMIPELSDLVDTGIVTKTTALAIMRNLSDEEQNRIIRTWQNSTYGKSIIYEGIVSLIYVFSTRQSVHLKCLISISISKYYK